MAWKRLGTVALPSVASYQKKILFHVAPVAPFCRLLTAGNFTTGFNCHLQAGAASGRVSRSNTGSAEIFQPAAGQSLPVFDGEIANINGIFEFTQAASAMRPLGLEKQ